jgi:hypothetical protein
MTQRIKGTMIKVTERRIHYGDLYGRIGTLTGREEFDPSAREVRWMVDFGDRQEWVWFHDCVYVYDTELRCRALRTALRKISRRYEEAHEIEAQSYGREYGTDLGHDALYSAYDADVRSALEQAGITAVEYSRYLLDASHKEAAHLDTFDCPQAHYEWSELRNSLYSPFETSDIDLDFPV